MVEYRKDSMYRETSLVDNKYLDVLEYPIDAANITDMITITVKSKYEHRPDLLAYEMYGNPKFWWVFAMYNQDKLLDPIVDFISGLEITIPKKFI